MLIREWRVLPLRLQARVQTSNWGRDREGFRLVKYPRPTSRPLGLEQSRAAGSPSDRLHLLQTFRSLELSSVSAYQR